MMENDGRFELADGGKTLVRCKAERVRDCVVPDGVETIESTAFRNCISLSRIALWKGIRTTENDAFENCRSLVHVEIPPDAAFDTFGCTARVGCGRLSQGTPRPSSIPSRLGTSFQERSLAIPFTPNQHKQP